jgi:hypothetical protein
VSEACLDEPRGHLFFNRRMARDSAMRPVDISLLCIADVLALAGKLLATFRV